MENFNESEFLVAYFVNSWYMLVKKLSFAMVYLMTSEGKSASGEEVDFL